MSYFLLCEDEKGDFMKILLLMFVMGITGANSEEPVHNNPKIMDQVDHENIGDEESLNGVFRDESAGDLDDLIAPVDGFGEMIEQEKLMGNPYTNR